MEFETVYNGEWWPVEGETYQQCCDCGLCHRLFFRIKDGKVEMRADRDDKRTRKARRAGGLTHVRAKKRNGQ